MLCPKAHDQTPPDVKGRCKGSKIRANGNEKKV
nr:MAG TPA: hypothetical protein [Bacteriophage sp.]